MNPEKELIQLLADYPDLIDYQHALYKKLESIKNPNTRMKVIFEEMADKLQELQNEINKIIINRR